MERTHSYIASFEHMKLMGDYELQFSGKHTAARHITERGFEGSHETLDRRFELRLLVQQARPFTLGHSFKLVGQMHFKRGSLTDREECIIC